MLPERVEGKQGIGLTLDAEAVEPLLLLTPDLQPGGLPDLATREGQHAVNEHIGDEIELIVVDNISALVRSGDENDANDWLPVQDWLLGLRARGRQTVCPRLIIAVWPQIG